MTRDKDINEVNLLGTLGRDPETRILSTGNPMVTMNVATDERWTDKKSGETKKATTWHRVVTFDVNLCERAARMKKGDRVAVTGRIENRTWETDGVKKYATQVTVAYGGKIEAVGGKPAPAESNKFIDDDLDSAPF